MNNLPALISTVEAKAEAFQKVLPKTIPVDRFLAAAKTALLTVPGIDTCDPQSVFLACLAAAQDGLVPNGRDAVLVVGRTRKGPSWGNAAQYWVMVQGLQKIAFRSGYLMKLESRIVHENDSFQLTYGTTPGIHHQPRLRDKGEIVGVYCIATLKGGQTYVEWMDRDEVDGIMRRSKSFDREKGEARGPWLTDYSEMCRKTVTRRALKYLPTEASASRDEEDGEGELAPGPVAALTEAGITYTTLSHEPERPAEVPYTAHEEADAELLAEVPSRRDPEVKPPTEPESEVTVWKRRLRDLRDALASCSSSERVEAAWSVWDEQHHPPAEVTERAKGLVDERLEALSYNAAKEGV